MTGCDVATTCIASADLDECDDACMANPYNKIW